MILARTSRHPVQWALLGAVVAVVLLLLWWAVSKDVVCTLEYPARHPCTRESRILPATIGLIAVLVLAVATALTAVLGPRGWQRPVLVAGTVLTGITGLVLVVVTLFSAGFSLP